MGGQMKAAAFNQEKHRQRSTQMGQTALTDGHEEGNQSSAPFFPLDDPVLEAVKCHLTTGSRIGFEPISRRFNRIAFFFKTRMEMKFVGFGYNRASLQLVVKGRNGENECTFDITINDIENALHSLFLRIQKWRSVDFAYHASRMQEDLIAGQFLSAILDESRAVINVRRFLCRVGNEQLHEKIAEFIQRGTPNLRSLSLDLCNVLAPLPVLVQAIGACHKLRRLAIRSSAPAGHFPPSFLPMLLGLQKLDVLVVGYCVPGRFMVALHSLSISSKWLPHFAQPAFHPLLKKMEKLNVDCWEDFWPIADLTSILTEMRSPAHVVVNHRDATWPTMWNDLLPMVHSTRANVLISLRYGLCRLTAEEYAAGLSTLPAIAQISIISPDLQNAPLNQYNYRYRQLKFRFSTGGQLTVERAQ